MRRHTPDRPTVGTTGFQSCCVSGRPKTASEAFRGARAVSETASWRAATTVRAESPRPVIVQAAATRLALATRYLLLTGVLVGAVGLGGRFLAWPLLTSTIGPTAYTFAAHPHSEAARFRNAVTGHGVALGCGLAALAVFGLTQYPAISATGSPSLRQVAAAATGVGVTVLALELVGSHHAPAAATTLLITTGLAKPGAPFVGLVLGLAIVIMIGPLIGRLPLARALARVSTSSRTSGEVNA